ncbi:hypothetical protein CIB48_g4271 [Xylaria polymorpha]|nr:hypothetical protein CIB48_g4271 [Xylaria polymorpha]
MKSSNIKLTIYLTTAIMSEALAKGLGTTRPAGLAGIYDGTFTRAILQHDAANEWPLCDSNDVSSESGDESVEKLCRIRQEISA